MGCHTDLVRHLLFYSQFFSESFAKFTKAFLEQEDSTTEKGYCYHGNVMAYAQMNGERKSLNEKNK